MSDSVNSRDSGGQRPESGAGALARRRAELAATALPGETLEQAAMRILAQQPSDAAETPVKRGRKRSTLPAWPETMRCVPNEVLRCNLFNARNRKVKRIETMPDHDLVVLFNGRITYGGPELRQDDETVWLQLVHLARTAGPGEPVEFVPKSFLESIGWPINSQSYATLRKCLQRFQKTSLAIYSDRLQAGISLNMLPKFEWQDANRATLRRYRVVLPPELVELFSVGSFSRIEWQQRLALPVGIATWLHGYYSTHREPYAVKLDTIQAGCGVMFRNASDLHDTVAKALKALVEVGFLESFEIADGTVHVKRRES